MAEVNCNACEEIRQTSPEFIVNGLTDDICTSLQNDTGLSPSNENDDCHDLHNLNDCLVGNMATEVEAYDVCDWKEFMRNFIPNLWTTIKGVVCSICGMWKAIHKLECLVNYLYEGDSFSFGETSKDTTSYIVMGKGVSCANVSASGLASDLAITFIAGGVARIHGSCLVYTENFHDRVAGYNYDDNGVEPTKSASRKGNAAWSGADEKPGGYGSQLFYELRILKSEFPQVRRFFTNGGLNEEGGGYHCEFVRYAAGDFAPGQFGRCDRHDGTPSIPGNSRGHQVPDGWEYIQCRITWVERMYGNEDGRQYTPTGLVGIRMNKGEVPC